MSNRKKAEWIQRIEYSAYRAAARRLRNVSADKAMRWGTRLGALAQALIRRRNALAMRNLQLAFSDRPAAELRNTLDACWRHFGRQIVGYVRLQQMPPEEADRHVAYVNLDILRQAQQLEKGVIVI